ncbi:nuA3 HAT complex component nto1 [Steccherinum ochraceum]|uniref:NuA3 HAT complex component nto1 n=1 Tax=Steccherinum ochraceum TaxID=92696 RepID=A0A4R0R286_9APHY|nr:nuA3 HAT complex component nto1 [Steccherinum ochraceum]
MARRAGTPPPALPKVSFTKVQDDYSKQPKGVHDLQARSYGYNDTNTDFQRPDHYIRYIEPLESELAIQVEYDMDEQDQAWLDSLNADRKKDQLDKISYETFEIVMDRLEKEWFDLTKNIPKSDFALPSEDSTCAICDDSEGENTNAIVFCDGCNLAVHQDCYGVPYIPEGQWLCRKCTVFPESPVSCILCPNEGGAFKQTAHGDWVHLLCAIWIPETRVANDVFMEPVTDIEKITRQRWKLRCEVCGIREGACIQCTKSSCVLAFHTTCARKERLLMPMKATQGLEAPTLACFCEKHLPKEQADAREAALEAEREAAEDETEGETPGTKSPKSSKTARAYAKTYKPGPPIVPFIIVRRILQYIGKIIIRHKEKFVLLVCKYWSLKREARRGAPLLKRLHLEPWTANSSSRQHTDEDKAIKLKYLKRLRSDLELVRDLTKIVRKREIQKLHQVEPIRDVLSLIIFPHEGPLRMAFEKIMSADRLDFFKNPVSKTEVPDYYEIIKKPMTWSAIDQKLDAHEYWDLQDFKDDVYLVLSNALTYNPPSTAIYRAAERVQNSANNIMRDLEEKLLQQKPAAEDAPTLNDAPALADNVNVTPSSLDTMLGNLEPPLPLLNLLTSDDSIKEASKLLLSSSPMTSLFSYELPVLKPLPTPPPKKPTRSEMAQARKRERKAAALDAAPGFRATRARRAASQTTTGDVEAEAEVPLVIPVPIPGAPPPEAAEGSRRTHKKPKVVLPGQPEEVAMVEDVDNQESFKYFDAGWVLPPERRRGNRPPVEKRPVPPPKKRQRTDREKSLLSTYSTSARENETLQTPSVGTVGLPDADVEVDGDGDAEPAHTDGEPEAQEPEPETVDEQAPDAMEVDDQAEPHEPEAVIPSEEPEVEVEPPPEVVPSEEDVVPPEVDEMDVDQPAADDNTKATEPLAVDDQEEAEEEYPPPEADVSMEVPPSEENPEADDSAEAPAEDEVVEEPQKDDDETVSDDDATVPDEEPGVLPDVQIDVESEDEVEPDEVVVGAGAEGEIPEAEEDVVVDADGEDEVPVVEEEEEEPIVERGDGAVAAESGDLEEDEDEPVKAEEEEKEEQQEEAEEKEGPESEDEEEPEPPRQIIIIETLDTPETRREKNKIKKEARLRMLAERDRQRNDEAGTSHESDGDEDEKAPSELTALSSSEDEEEPEAKPLDPNAVKLSEDGSIEGGTLVWAKLQSWPWWPAVVYEDDDSDIPEKIHEQKQLDEVNAQGRLYLVRFFDKKRHWQWLEHNKLLELGEDDVLDGDLLASTSRRQRWKKGANDKTGCRKAYRQAIEEKE